MSQLPQPFSDQLAILESGSQPASKPKTTAEEVATLKQRAIEIVSDKGIPSLERIIHLRAEADTLQTARFSERELQQLLWSARRSLAGAAEPIKRGEKIIMREAPWLWQDVILLGTTNLVVALPKVGKSRLLTAMWGRAATGTKTFLGKTLAKQKHLLIVGSDQTQRDWGKCLKLAGLMETDGTMHESIVALFHKGCPLHLDTEGISRIVDDYCENFQDLTILLDSYAACTAHLGLDEASAAFAEPLIDLQEAIAPYDATLIVIHHSNRNAAGSRVSQASRGTTALPAAVSQTISLAWADGQGESRDRRVRLSTEGREGEPFEAWIEQVDEGRDWILHGSGAELALNQRIEETMAKLTTLQEEALSTMCAHWDENLKGMDAMQLAKALQLEGKQPARTARATQVSLLNKKLIEGAGSREPLGTQGGQPAKLYKPTEAVLRLTRKLPPLSPEPPLPPEPPKPLVSPVDQQRGTRGGKGAGSEEGPDGEHLGNGRYQLRLVNE